MNKHRLIVKSGQAKVDTSLTDSPFFPKGKFTYELAQDREEYNRDGEAIEREQQYHKLKREE